MYLNLFYKIDILVEIILENQIGEKVENNCIIFLRNTFSGLTVFALYTMRINNS